MTALQDWLSTKPSDPRGLKAFICDAFRSLTAEEPAEVAEHTLLRPGIERC